MTPSRHIMIIAGELSGDIHGADLVRELRYRDPNLAFSGLGGPNMAAQGVSLYEDMTQLAVIGFVEIFRHFFQIKKLFNLVLTQCHKQRPDAVILIDYPGFNLRLAKALRRRGIKVLYYIAPKAWAWKERRVEMIKKYVDRLLIIFAFEKSFYAKHGYAADFVGNPLLDHIRVTSSRHDFLLANGLNPNAPTIGLIPGSRKNEIRTLLPIMLAAAKIIRNRIPRAQFLISQAPHLNESLLAQFRQDPSIPSAVIKDDFHNCIHACDICLTTSGTATLETAILKKPMVIIYKTAWLTALLARLLLKIRWVGLPNIIAGKTIVPECIQNDATPEKITRTLLAVYSDPFKMETTINALNDVTSALGEPGAAGRAADIILTDIRKNNR